MITISIDQGRASQIASLGRGVAAPFAGFARFRHDGEGEVGDDDDDGDHDDGDHDDCDDDDLMI